MGTPKPFQVLHQEKHVAVTKDVVKSNVAVGAVPPAISHSTAPANGNPTRDDYNALRAYTVKLHDALKAAGIVV